MEFIQIIDKILASCLWLFTALAIMVAPVVYFSNLRDSFIKRCREWRTTKYSLLYQCAQSSFVPFVAAAVFFLVGMKETFLALVVCQIVCTGILVTGSLLKTRT